MLVEDPGLSGDTGPWMPAKNPTIRGWFIQYLVSGIQYPSAPYNDYFITPWLVNTWCIVAKLV